MKASQKRTKRMEGTLAVAQPGELSGELVPAAIDAAQNCPVSAITISE